MKHTYIIEGMTCGNCVAKAKSELLKLGDVVEAEVQLAQPQATITMQRHIPLETLQSALHKAGNYTIREDHNGHSMMMDGAQGTSKEISYKPVYLIGIYLTGITLLVEAFLGNFELMRWMQNFMAGFFLTFSFFKMLDLNGFAQSYSTYDIVAIRWYGWGYVYPFIELTLGLLFLSGAVPLFTNGATFVVMSVSIVGVLQSVFRKRTIQCACLGTVFNLPMSTVTIMEDALMIVMSAVMFMILL